MGERTIGAIILVVSILVAIGYALWTFAEFLQSILPGIIPPQLVYISEWAIKLPVILIVYAFLSTVMWIGYTMATTPVPKPLERPLEVGEEKEKEEKAPKKE